MVYSWIFRPPEQGRGGGRLLGSEPGRGVRSVIGNKWYCKPDDERKSWGFLSLEKKESGKSKIITGWEIGYGNPQKMVQTLSSENSDEDVVLKRLLDELSFCRRNRILLTTFDPILPCLRTRVLKLGLSEVSLRGIKHICIKKTLEEYFSGLVKCGGLWELSSSLGLVKSKDNGGSRLGDLELLRRLLLAIGPLLPEKCFSQSSGQ